MKRTKEAGDIMTIIMVVIIFVLLCILGYVAWQKFGQQSGSSGDSDISKQDVTMLTQKVDAFIPTNLSFSYPSNWKLTHSSDGKKPFNDESLYTDLYEVTSPSGTVTVHVNLTLGGGIGGACQPEEMGKIESYAAEDVPALPGKKLIRYVVGTAPNAWQVKTELADVSKLNGMKVNESACNAVFAGVNEQPIAIDGLEQKHAVMSMAVLRGTQSDYASVTDAEAAAGGSEYNAAKKIVTSLTDK